MSTTVAERIKAVADLFPGRKECASAAGVSTDMLSRYMRDESQPAFMVLANMCKPVGVNLNWLAYNMPPMMISDEVGFTERGAGASINKESPDCRSLADIIKLKPMIEIEATIAYAVSEKTKVSSACSIRSFKADQGGRSLGIEMIISEVPTSDL